MQPGLTKVVAEADVIDGSPTVFTLSAAGPAVVLIRFGPLFDCLDPSFFPEVTEARVGSVVTWVYAKWPGFDCAAQLRSISVPPAGASFTSDVIKPGERFTFVPNVAGEWKYEDSMNGGTATLRVR